MKAMVIRKLGNIQEDGNPLEFTNFPNPNLGEGEILIKVSTCGVCHTELDEIEGRTPPPRLPMIPGHQVIGHVFDKGRTKTDLSIGQRVGVGWIHSTCGKCEFCLSGRENLCADFLATGRDANGGYAEYMAVPALFCYPIPESISDIESAPMLCAGAIGYRSLNLANIQDGDALGLTGFGASGHLVLKMARHLFPDSAIFVFTRSPKEMEYSRELGAAWAGEIDAKPPTLLNAIIDTTPAWKPIIEGLECLKPGGRLIINAIRKEDIDHEWLQKLDYSKHLWMEKEIKSVANVTRSDITHFLELADRVDIRPQTNIYPLVEANRAVLDLKFRRVHGAAVLIVGQ